MTTRLAKRCNGGHNDVSEAQQRHVRPNDVAEDPTAASRAQRRRVEPSEVAERPTKQRGRASGSALLFFYLFHVPRHIPRRASPPLRKIYLFIIIYIFAIPRKSGV